MWRVKRCARIWKKKSEMGYYNFMFIIVIISHLKLPFACFDFLGRGGCCLCSFFSPVFVLVMLLFVQFGLQVSASCPATKNGTEHSVNTL